MPASHTEYLPLALIDLPVNARPHDPVELKALADDMRLNGQLQEILVVRQGDRYEVVAGAGRLQAAQANGWEKIRCSVYDNLSAFDRLHLMFSENEARETPSPLFQAKLLQGMLGAEPGLTQETLAQRLGKTPASVSQYLSLGGLDPNLTEKLNRFNFLGLSHILQLKRLAGLPDQLLLAEQAQNERLSVRELKARVGQKLKPREGEAKSSVKSLAEDPLSDYWKAFSGAPELQGLARWKMARKGKVWSLELEPDPAKALTAMAEWFAAFTPLIFQAAELQGSAPSPTGLTAKEPPVPDVAAWLGQNDPAALKPMRLPTTPSEQAELEALAPQGPAAIYAWLYGPDHLLTRQFAHATWGDMGQTDPVEAIRQMVDEFREGNS